ncbi:hypothetical protein V6N12_048326 [Hibiscus sabdariffa]|uniref:Uncharacterized protein n=1 Tax=Hibiscus sabdariffa TaxID=183260 RepID=A0ABR2EGX1_9ROSI
MSLKGLTMRSQRQAAYGLIPDSVFFCLLFISQLPLLEPTLPAGGKSRERGQTRVPLLDVNIITGFALGQLLVPRELDSMVGLQGHCPMLVGLYWFSLFCFMPKTIGPTMSLERERCCCYNILFSSCVVLLDL